MLIREFSSHNLGGIISKEQIGNKIQRKTYVYIHSFYRNSYLYLNHSKIVTVLYNMPFTSLLHYLSSSTQKVYDPSYYIQDYSMMMFRISNSAILIAVAVLLSSIADTHSQQALPSTPCGASMTPGTCSDPIFPYVATCFVASTGAQYSACCPFETTTFGIEIDSTCLQACVGMTATEESGCTDYGRPELAVCTVPAQVSTTGVEAVYQACCPNNSLLGFLNGMSCLLWDDFNEQNPGKISPGGDETVVTNITTCVGITAASGCTDGELYPQLAVCTVPAQVSTTGVEAVYQACCPNDSLLGFLDGMSCLLWDDFNEQNPGKISSGGNEIAAPVAAPVSFSETDTATPEENRTPQPTEQPTEKPTNAPTFAPTQKPTRQPTIGPSRAPTRAPTHSPTRRPTRAPSRRPTRTPTRAPTRTPTRHPTEGPTNYPTDRPTHRPTNHPTDRPTSDPTPQPTPSPNDGSANNLIDKVDAAGGSTNTGSVDNPSSSIMLMMIMTMMTFAAIIIGGVNVVG